MRCRYGSGSIVQLLTPKASLGSCIRVEPCPISEACIRDAFWLPHRVLMADEETVREVAAVIRSLRTR